MNMATLKLESSDLLEVELLSPLWPADGRYREVLRLVAPLLFVGRVIV